CAERAEILSDARTGGGTHGCVHRRCVGWCAPDASSGGGFRESSGSISDRRNDSNSETEKEKSRIEIANFGNGGEAKPCARTRADEGGERSGNTNGHAGREKGRAPAG